MTAVLVLGGADGSLTTLGAAATLGLRTVCVDMRSDAPGAAVADELLNVSSRDVDAVLEAMGGRTDIAGVLSPASDVNVPAQFEIARRLGLPCGLSSASVRASVDKGYFRAVCDRLGSPGPRYLQGLAEDIRDRAADVASVVMVKPTDSSGSRGITKVSDPDLIPAAIDYAARWSPTSVVIVEEYLEAKHYSVEAVVQDGRVALLGLTERRLTDPPNFVTVQHLMSAGRTGLSARLQLLLDELCTTLGYRWGSLNVDVMVTVDGEVVLGEWGARLGGNGSADLLELATGVDATAAAVLMAVGERVDATPRAHHVAGSRVLGTEIEGRLVGIEGMAAAHRIPGVTDLVLAVGPGDHVEPYTQAGNKLGYALARGDDRDAVLAALDEVEATLRFTVEQPALVH